MEKLWEHVNMGELGGIWNLGETGGGCPEEPLRANHVASPLQLSRNPLKQRLVRESNCEQEIVVEQKHEHVDRKRTRL